jgi:hypothetical protein
MLALSTWRIGLIAAAACCIASVASAQNVILDAPGLVGTKKAPAAPPPRAPVAVWPRLDPGAVICKTSDDLERHAANNTARVSGGDTQPADCRVINQPTGIQILSRQGPGSTQVKLSNPANVIGWTDVWLPDKAPSGR